MIDLFNNCRKAVIYSKTSLSASITLSVVLKNPILYVL